MKSATLLGFSALVLASCSSLDQFDVTLSQTGVLPGALSQAVRGFGQWPAGASATREIENQGVAPEDITSAKVKSGTIKVTAPATGHLAYLSNLEIFVSADGVPEKRIAHQDADFANRKSTYDLLVDDVELKPYLTAPSMKLRPVITERSKPTTDHDLQIDLVVHVDLSVIQ